MSRGGARFARSARAAGLFARNPFSAVEPPGSAPEAGTFNPPRVRSYRWRMPPRLSSWLRFIRAAIRAAARDRAAGRTAAGGPRPPGAPAWRRREHRRRDRPHPRHPRELQRRFAAAVVLVHHARKSRATRAGQALRGSSELHAWGDSNLYLRRRDGQIVMSAEHRAAPGLNDVEIELADDGEGPALRLRRTVPDQAPPQSQSAEQRIVQVLAKAGSPCCNPRSENASGRATPPSPRHCTSLCARDVSSEGREVATASSAPWPTKPPARPAPTCRRSSPCSRSRSLSVAGNGNGNTGAQCHRAPA